MEAFLVSTGVVAIAEIGDKTQLLAILLASRFRKPWPIVAGIFAATVANHLLAASVGTLIADFLGGEGLRWILGAGFVAMGLWALVPDKMDDDAGPGAGAGRMGAFMATLVAFFLVEMGDKTQVATVALAARFGDLVAVTMGTTFGMMLANVPAVFLGEAVTRVVPLAYVRAAAAAILIAVGAFTLIFGLQAV
ncbi:TMEM165/GDT1 family protein [Zavarzinia compransoris]|uniref:TMEM165/GDT1 family protein n=1 Tax=Zavarzinia marina TaxID=2911065 RepID=UPI001F478260|nr:TMEM165/GDT1 family protein [Zavarzinia marina]MCF4166855.1 TMEM165/GDT1 family protein [Zavarzinia marina]